MNEYLEPVDQQENNKRSDQNQSADKKKNAIGKSKESNKKKHFNVLHKDGRLADLPYNNEPGGGPLEGTVGIGT
jgi:hypothetical protein